MEIKLSACTITKNEANNIKKSIDSYKQYVDEIIVVDTGSVDDTVKVASDAGARVLNFEWNNDFSAAKNFALDNAHGDWIIFLDADEWFDGDSAKDIKKAIEKSVSKGYSSVACKLVNFADENEVMEVGCTARIFKHDSNIRFNRPIHEALFDMTNDRPIPSLYNEALIVNHSGYMRSVLKNKAKRNKKLLDKTFAMGKCAPIDYFYGLRENIGINPEMAAYFLEIIKSIPDYSEKISSFSVGPMLDDCMFKLVSKLPNKYTYDDRMKVLKNAQNNYPENPLFKYYEYSLLYNFDRAKAILALEDAIRLSNDYEKNYPNRVNSFYPKIGEAFAVLGEYELLIGNKSKALEYFMSSAKAEYANSRAINGIVSIIKGQETEEIVLFLNTIYDMDNKEVLRSLVENLRATSMSDVFLYYFVKYNKKFNDIDSSLFTARIITHNYDEMIDTYMKVFNESKDIRALTFVVAASILKGSKEDYSKISGNVSSPFSNIVSAYLENEKLVSLTDDEYKVAVEIFSELAFVAKEDVIMRYINVLGKVGERIWVDVIKYYFCHYEYDLALKYIEAFNKVNIENDDFKAYINCVLTSIYFRTGAIDNIEDALNKAISGGVVDAELVMICRLLEANDEKIDEYYDLFENYVEVKKLYDLEELEDIEFDSSINIDKFESYIKNSKIKCIQEQANMFFMFAESALSKKAFAYAEKNYKIALKFNYNIDKCYYALGGIYNHFGKPELSAYCYEKAFCENLVFTRQLVDEKHKNYNYVFSIKEESCNTICPICGKECKDAFTFSNAADDELSYDVPIISKFMKCDECNHIFVKNGDTYCINNFLHDKEDIVSLYRIFEELEKLSNIKNVGTYYLDDKVFNDVACNMGYDVAKIDGVNSSSIVYVGEFLNGSYGLEEKMNSLSNMLIKDQIAIFEIFDFENAFSKSEDRPLWAKPTIQNVFSKKSFTKLINNYNMKIIKTMVNYANKGQLIVFAVKMA